MRNIRIAPPEDRVSAMRSPGGVAAPVRRRRLRDWAATLPILILVPALSLPFVGAQAAGPRLTLAPSAATPGAVVRVDGRGFPDRATGVVTLDGTNVSVAFTARRNGSFRAHLSVPTDAAAGVYQVVGATRSGVRASVPLSITVPDSAPLAPAPPSVAPEASQPTITSPPAPQPTANPTTAPAPVPSAGPTSAPASSAPTVTNAPTRAPETAAPTVAPPTIAPPPPSAGDYLLITRANLLARPTSGSAWTALLGVADGSLGTADLCNQDSKHAVRTLGVALVYARTGTASYRTKARDAIMGALPTMQAGCSNAILSLGRQLGAYVLAADLIRLSGGDESTFRTWLSTIRTRELGGHSRWHTLQFTASDSSNNWGAFAQGSLVAANAYLGDTANMAADWRRFRGFTGDASAHTFPKPNSVQASWMCASAWTPVQRCAGDPRDAAITEDAWRSGTYPTISLTYVQESMQGLGLAAEILQRSGYDAWPRLRPVADFATRWNVWNASSVGRHLPWLYNKRLGISAPLQASGMGRVFGFTDWLYGS